MSPETFQKHQTIFQIFRNRKQPSKISEKYSKSIRNFSENLKKSFKTHSESSKRTEKYPRNLQNIFINPKTS